MTLSDKILRLVVDERVVQMPDLKASIKELKDRAEGMGIGSVMKSWTDQIFGAELS